jgi:hypothetical protein
MSQGGAILNSVSLSMMKANFARELKQMIDNEVQQDKKEK